MHPPPASSLLSLLTSRSALSLTLILLCLLKPDRPAEGAEIRTSSGDWGTLQYYEIVTRPPSSSLFPSLLETRSIWSFPLAGRTEVKDLFDELEFSLDLKTLIHEEAKWTVQGDHVELEVNDAIIEAMKPDERFRLSAWWRDHHYDYWQRVLNNFDDRDFVAISKSLSPEMMDRLRPLCFLRGNVLSIIDRPYLLRKLETQEERESITRTLFTTHGLIARLEVNPDTDLEPIIEYWEAGGRNPGVRSVIQGMKSTEGVDHLDLVHLLPPIPSKYLNTFATFDDVSPDTSPDCFWTSIQFFRDRISHRSFDLLPVEHFILDDFDEVEGPTQFGDLVCLFDEETREFVHSYIHIVDGIVFTKNGGSLLRPWILSTYDRMMAIYNTQGGFHQQTYRSRIDP